MVMPDNLFKYWVKGEGAPKIRWGTPGDFNRCVLQLSKYMGPNEAKGACANLHKRATGARPGQAPGEKH